MAQKIDLNKEVFSKRTYQKTIDTSFKELGVKSIQEQLDTQPTVQEFFDMYGTLFYNINELGPTNSHEFLIKTSQEYIGNKQENEVISLLQDEIAALRIDLLNSQKQLGDLVKNIGAVDENGNPIDFSTSPEEEAGLSDTTTALGEVNTNTQTLQNQGKDLTDPNIKRVMNDYKKYPNSSYNKRSERTGLSKGYIIQVKNKYDL